MKRSEMIKVLFDYNKTLTMEQPDPDWEYVLTLLEQAGMAPPEIAEQVKTSVMVATPFGYQEMVVDDSKVFVRKWEDEA